MPLPILTVAQMRAWEEATWSTGQAPQAVIQQVGKALAHRALALTRPGDAILILAGKGHNGDDARAAAPHLAERQVCLLSITDPATQLAALDAALAQRPALVVDGLFGIGLDRSLSEEWCAGIRRVNAARLPVLAVDVPSGLNADTGEPQPEAIEAALTLTLGAPKEGLLKPSAWPFVGRLEVAPDIGLAPAPPTADLRWTMAHDFDGFPPRRPIAGHKGAFGHLGIIAGSLGYHGAAVLAARGAQRARPGLITVLPTENAYFPVAAQLQSAMVRPFAPQMKLPGEFTALLAGPGLAGADVTEETRQVIRRAWRDSFAPVIVDASALDWLNTDPFPRAALRVITPHPGEAARLLKGSTAQVQADRRAALQQISRRFAGTWVVLKGHQTLVGRAGEGAFVNSSGNPGLAQGGSGDLLAGYVAGLLAQPALQADPSLALRFAVWQHGAAADFLEARQPNWNIEDLAAELGRVPAARG